MLVEDCSLINYYLFAMNWTYLRVNRSFCFYPRLFDAAEPFIYHFVSFLLHFLSIWCVEDLKDEIFPLWSRLTIYHNVIDSHLYLLHGEWLVFPWDSLFLHHELAPVHRFYLWAFWFLCLTTIFLCCRFPPKILFHFEVWWFISFWFWLHCLAL